MEVTFKKIYDQCEGTTEGIAIFDALGLPTENLEEAEITKNSPTAADEYLRCPSTHPSHLEHFPGRWSDDTQLTLAVQAAIIKNEGNIDLKTIAEEHVKAARESVMGWGGATEESTQRLSKNDFDYKISGKEGAAGNGVIMKMSPLVLAMHYHPDYKSLPKKLELLQDFTFMTHRSNIALVCAAVHAEVFEEVLMTQLDQLETEKGRHELLARALNLAEKYEAEYGESEKHLSQRLRPLLGHFQELSNNKVLLSLANGGKFFVPDTLTMCYGLIGSKFSFDAARRAVMIGGDTDSNAAIVGSMVGLKRPLDELEPSIRMGLWRREEIFESARTFASVLLKRTQTA